MQKEFARVNGGVANQCIDRAVGSHPLHCVCNRFRIGDIGEKIGKLALTQSARLFESGPCATNTHHSTTIAGEPDCERSPDSCTGAGDNDGLDPNLPGSCKELPLLPALSLCEMRSSSINARHRRTSSHPVLDHDGHDVLLADFGSVVIDRCRLFGNQIRSEAAARVCDSTDRSKTDMSKVRRVRFSARTPMVDPLSDEAASIRLC
jgi:hypothetical protein